MPNQSSLNRRQFSLAAGLSLGSGLSWAQTPAYPNKTVSLVVPFPPGGAVDQAGRAISQALFKVWKHHQE